MQRGEQTRWNKSKTKARNCGTDARASAAISSRSAAGNGRNENWRTFEPFCIRSSVTCPPHTLFRPPPFAGLHLFLPVSPTPASTAPDVCVCVCALRDGRNESRRVYFQLHIDPILFIVAATSALILAALSIYRRASVDRSIVSPGGPLSSSRKFPRKARLKFQTIKRAKGRRASALTPGGGHPRVKFNPLCPFQCN